MRLRIFWIVLIFVMMVFGLEAFLRISYGFCDAVLMQEDPDFEYIAQPNQSRYRFRKRVYYNEHSMRCNQVEKTAVKILGFGDSVLNGGTLTDQDSLATTILSHELSRYCDTVVQVLNISAGSWGPDNCFAYLNKNGDFNARQILLVVSSHDAYDNMDFQKIVGVDESFPSRQYPSAILEIFDRYLFPGVWHRNSMGSLGINKSANEFNRGFGSFVEYCESKSVPLVLYLHAELRERERGDYSDKGRQIIDFANRNHVKLIRELDYQLDVSDYRDNIHLSESGQRKMAQIIFNEIITKPTGCIGCQNKQQSVSSET